MNIALFLNRQPRYGTSGFQLEEGYELESKWNQIPDDTDVLITHGPPYGYGDCVHHDYNVGCRDLLDTVKFRVKPQYHIFGHIHEGLYPKTAIK
jgi:Icc-related predicted phosphoesterase